MGPFNKGEFTATDASANTLAVPYGIARAISFQNKSDVDCYGSPATGNSYLQDVETGSDVHAVVGRGVLIRAQSDVTVDDANYTPHQTTSLGNNAPSQEWYFVTATGETANVSWQRY